MGALSGKSALVTGATGGIGEAIARKLAAEGAKVALSGTREEKLKEVQAGIDGSIILPANLGDAEAINGLIADATEQLEGIDILICNAGVTKDNLTMRMKDEEWEQVLRINLDAGFRLNRGVLRGMMKKRWGRIVNITSVVGTMGNPGQANYCASKAGLQGMSKSIAMEVASRGITVNCIAPGFIKTPMTEALDEKQTDRITSNIPAGRFGLPEDIAAAAAFLASDNASYLTGQTLHVNGGLLMV
ncbi:MAG: 3-oxoacyl-[acyl-carrier-protein] reductase [Rickettsiales bacterium]|nr:3-oxoacyl-[acyl-carrier-protein] reductase [Rickettsiales bacterium]